MTTKVTLTAVHDTDLLKVLKKLNIYDSIVRGELQCSICGKKIVLENLGGLYKGCDGSAKLVCNNIKCLYKAAEITSRSQR